MTRRKRKLTRSQKMIAMAVSILVVFSLGALIA